MWEILGSELTVWCASRTGIYFYFKMFELFLVVCICFALMYMISTHLFVPAFPEVLFNGTPKTEWLSKGNWSK